MPYERHSYPTDTPFPAYPDVPVKKGTVASRIQAYNLVRDDPVILARRRSRALERLTTTLKQRRDALAERREPYRSNSTTSTNDGGRRSKDIAGSSPALAEHVRSGFGRRVTQRFALPAERTSSYGFSAHSGIDSSRIYGTSASGTSASDAAQLRGYFSRRPAGASIGYQHQMGADATQSTHNTLDHTVDTPSYDLSREPSHDYTSIDMSTPPPSHDCTGFPDLPTKPRSDIEAVLGRQLDVEELKGIIEEVKRQHAQALVLEAKGSDNNDLHLKQDVELLRGSIAEILERPGHELQGTDHQDKPTWSRTDSVQQRFADTPLQQPSPLISQGYFHPDTLLSTASSPALVPSTTATALLERRSQQGEPDLSGAESVSSSTLSSRKVGGKRRRRPRADLEATGSNTSDTRLPRSSLDTERCYGGTSRKVSTSLSPGPGPPDRGRKRQVHHGKAVRRHITVSPPVRSKRRRRLPSSVAASVGTKATESSSESDFVSLSPEAVMADDRHDPREDTSTAPSHPTHPDNGEPRHSSYPHTTVTSQGNSPSHGINAEQQGEMAVKSTRRPSIQSFASSQLSGKQAVGKSSWWKFGIANKIRQTETTEKPQGTERPKLTLADTETDSPEARSPEAVSISAISAISAKGTMTPSNASFSRPQSLKSYSSTVALPRARPTVQATQSSLKHPLGQKSSGTEEAKTARIMGSKVGKTTNNPRKELGDDYQREHKASAPSVSVASEHGPDSQVRIRGFSVVVNFDGRDDLIITAQLPTPNPTGISSYSSPASD